MSAPGMLSAELLFVVNEGTARTRAVDMKVLHFEQYVIWTFLSFHRRPCQSKGLQCLKGHRLRRESVLKTINSTFRNETPI